MRVLQIKYRVVVESDTCWAHLRGEQSQDASCRVCVSICPELFEKARDDTCARVRLDTDPSPFLERVRDAIQLCPTKAIRLVARIESGASVVRM